jgi:hypothetical protein
MGNKDIMDLQKYSNISCGHSHKWNNLLGRITANSFVGKAAHYGASQAELQQVSEHSYISLNLSRRITASL